jgi:hypothetical protein
MPDRCTSTQSELRCQLQAPHTSRRHRHERPDGVLGTWVTTWVTPDLDTQPEYPLGPVELEPCVASREDFRG